MADQQSMNLGTWAALQEAGFVPGNALEIDSFFFAPDEGTAEVLSADLTGRGWSAQVTSSVSGFFRKRVEWGAIASRTGPVESVAQLDLMVADLESVAAQHGADFDGWGAEIPG